VVGIWAGRGMLVAFGLVSLLGMPAQDPLAAFTFWTIAFWYVSMVDVPSGGAPVSGVLSQGPAPIVAAIAVAVLYGAGTARLAASDLRVPVRAQRTGWYYLHGFERPAEPDAAEGYRLVASRAVLVLDPTDAWMELTVAPASEGVTLPIAMTLTRDRGEPYTLQVSDAAPRTYFVEMPPGNAYAFLEFRIGVPAVKLKWRFVPTPPFGAGRLPLGG
jgi:hypothetical protein